MSETTKEIMQQTARDYADKMSAAAAQSAKAQEEYCRAKHTYESFCRDAGIAAYSTYDAD